MEKIFSRCLVLWLAAYCNRVFPFETHCEKKEQVIFNCQLENSEKYVSVCKIGNENQDDQYLQYKFGKIGKVELTFPNTKNIRDAQFSIVRQYSNLAGHIEYNLAFSIGRNKYNVFWMEISQTDGVPKEEAEVSSGVNVLTASGENSGFSCSKDVTQHFMSATTTYVRNVEWENGQ